MGLGSPRCAPQYLVVQYQNCKEEEEEYQSIGAREAMRLGMNPVLEEQE